MKPRVRNPKAAPAHDTPRLGKDRRKVRPIARKPDPKGRYETGAPDPEEARKSPWVDEGGEPANG